MAMNGLRKPILKIILLGDSTVGKTSLLNQFVLRKFSDTYRGTIGADFYLKDVVVDHRLVTLQVWDTVGQERFRSLGVPYFRGADCAVLVFDVTSTSSFRSLEFWKDEFLAYGSPADARSFPFVVLGNKVDLGGAGRYGQDAVQSVLGCDYDVPYFETSAKENVNVDEAFAAAAEMALEREKTDPLFDPLPERTVLSRPEKRRCSCLC